MWSKPSIMSVLKLDSFLKQIIGIVDGLSPNLMKSEVKMGMVYTHILKKSFILP